MEEKYWELLEEVERAYDKYLSTRSPWDFAKYEQAKDEFAGVCMLICAILMEENSDVLARLKG